MSDRGVPYPGGPKRDACDVYREEESRDSRGGGREAVTFASDTS
jgi:hypothetical protein